MPALFPIICPHCGKPGKVPAELDGKSIRCRACKKIFLVQLPAQTQESMDAQLPIRRPMFQKAKFWGIICLVGIFLVIGFDLFWWFGLESWWKPMDEFLGLTSISLGIRVWEVVLSFVCFILPLGVLAFVLFIQKSRSRSLREDWRDSDDD
jgi:hypothetical protein